MPEINHGSQRTGATAFKPPTDIPVAQARKSLIYLAVLAGAIGLAFACAWLLLSEPAGDHLTAIAPAGKPSWYQDLAGNYVTEIQDQDLFFHDIGHSIDYARRADIIILGSSLVSFAVNEDVVREQLEKPYGLKFYNMAFVGVASGEFARRIIEKYDIHPRLWIINADDGGGGGNFFSRNLTRAFGADVKEIPAAKHGYLRAYYDVMRRNLRWRLENITGLKWLAPPKAGVIPMFYRNDQTGAADMSMFPHFLTDGNPTVKMARDPNCHTTPEAIGIAHDFVRSLRSPVVLTLVPNYHGCATQVREIAKATDIDVAIPARTDYSSWDNGGHLDKNGSIEFTRDLVDSLKATAAFQTLIRGHAR